MWNYAPSVDGEGAAKLRRPLRYNGVISVVKVLNYSYTSNYEISFLYKPQIKLLF